MRLAVDLAVGPVTLSGHYRKSEQPTAAVDSRVDRTVWRLPARRFRVSRPLRHRPREVRDFHRPRMDLLATRTPICSRSRRFRRGRRPRCCWNSSRLSRRGAWMSFSCRDGRCVSHGEAFADCAALADRAGANRRRRDQLHAPAAYLRRCWNRPGACTPLMVYPNSGEHWISKRTAGRARNADVPGADWYERGARLFGGCCRTGPEDIRRIRSELIEIAGLSCAGAWQYAAHDSRIARLRRTASPEARWQSGYAAACKAVYAGSIPTLASIPFSFSAAG